MQAEAYIQSGDLDNALTELTAEIRKNPAKAEMRVFLFQLLSVLGQWDRAMTQLNVAAEMDADAALMAQVFRPALNCEAFRADVFQGERTPLFFGEPSDWMVSLTRIPCLLAVGRFAEAIEMRDRAFDAAPAVSGQIDGKPFAWMADADERLGPILEALVDGKYYWIPFERISKICIEKPVNLRDVVWISATFTWTNQGQAVGLIPVRYPGTEKSESGSLRLSRKTEWQNAGDDFYIGMGQRMLATDQGEYPLLDIREVDFDTTDASDTGS